MTSHSEFQLAWPGTPKPAELWMDARLGARSQIATTITLIIVMATVCFAILVTTGQSAASEARVVEQIDSAGTRLIALSDDAGAAGISPLAPAVISTFSDVTWVFGLGEAVDTTNPLLREGRAAARALVGELPSDISLVAGRMPLPGEAIAGVGAADTLRLGKGLGAITEVRPGFDPVGVVGLFQASGPLENLNNIVLIATPPETISTLRFVYVLAADVSVVERLEQALETSTPAENLMALTVESPTGAIALRDVIAGRLGAASRQLMAVVMMVGTIIIAVTMLSATVSRRRDFGRRRALGATRSAIVVGLLMQTSIGVAIGIAAGSSMGLLWLWFSTGSIPSWRFTTGVAGLAFLLALVAATPIATEAAHRDPLRILRVP